jgi:hypothetical protein
MKTVTDSRGLVAFFYLLMRDHLTSGKVETIMDQVKDLNHPAEYSNGFLAEHAQELADMFLKDK